MEWIFQKHPKIGWKKKPILVYFNRRTNVRQYFFFVFFYKYLLRIECTENEVNNVHFFSKFTLWHKHKHKETTIWIPNTVSVDAAYRARDEHMQIIVCFLVSMRWWQKHCVLNFDFRSALSIEYTSFNIKSMFRT